MFCCKGLRPGCHLHLGLISDDFEATGAAWDEIADNSSPLSPFPWSSPGAAARLDAAGHFVLRERLTRVLSFCFQERDMSSYSPRHSCNSAICCP